MSINYVSNGYVTNTYVISDYVVILNGQSTIVLLRNTETIYNIGGGVSAQSLIVTVPSENYKVYL